MAKQTLKLLKNDNTRKKPTQMLLPNEPVWPVSMLTAIKISIRDSGKSIIPSQFQVYIFAPYLLVEKRNELNKK